MKTYRVAICLEEGVVIQIQAEDEKSALRKAEEIGNEFGGTNYPTKYKQNCVHRDVFTQDAEEI